MNPLPKYKFEKFLIGGLLVPVKGSGLVLELGLE